MGGVLLHLDVDLHILIFLIFFRWRTLQALAGLSLPFDIGGMLGGMARLISLARAWQVRSIPLRPTRSGLC